MSYSESRPGLSKKAFTLALTLPASCVKTHPTEWRGNGEKPVYISHRHYPNPHLSNLVSQFTETVSTYGTISQRHFETLPWSQYMFSKGNFLQMWMAFADQHNLTIDPDLYVPRLGAAFVKHVIYMSAEENRQITLLEQFKIALELSDNHILGAAVIAHAGSRAIGKGGDNRVATQYQYSAAERDHWRDCVSSFELISGEYGEPQSDTFHFWGTMVCGLTANRVAKQRDILVNPIYSWLFRHTADLTQILRNKPFNKRQIHRKQADLAGFYTGTQLFSTLTGQSP